MMLRYVGYFLCVSSVMAAPFSGFYAGAQTGWTHRVNQTNLSSITVSSATANDFKQSSRFNGINYGAFGGYGKNWNSFYLGSEVGIEKDNASKESVYSVPGVGSVKTLYKRGTVFGLSPRMGWLCNPNSLAYAKLGIETSRDRLESQAVTSTESVRMSGSYKTKTTLVPGFGFERNFGKIIGRVEYDYNLGSKLRKQDGNDTIRFQQSGKYTAHNIKLGVVYPF